MLFWQLFVGKGHVTFMIFIHVRISDIEVQRPPEWFIKCAMCLLLFIGWSSRPEGCRGLSGTKLVEHKFKVLEVEIFLNLEPNLSLVYFELS